MESSYYDRQLGAYMPSIPLPFFGRSKWWRFWEKYGCSCGRYFKKQIEYEVHFALTHIPPYRKHPVK